MASKGSRGKRIALSLLALLLVAAGGAAVYLLQRYPNDVPVTYEDATQHFLRGSIGGDTDNGLPKRIMEVLPTLFADLLPPGAPHDWTAFGFQVDPGEVIPLGFSERTMRVPLVGMNCALCHTGVVRASADAPPQRILGMGSTTLDLEGFFGFLFQVVADPRYTPENLIAAMEARAPMDALDRFVYGKVVTRFKEGLEKRKAMLGALFAPDRPGFGPGRVDTFNPYKLSTLGQHYPDGLTPEEAIGNARYASIWAQEKKKNRALNWDGNAPRIEDRNAGAAFGAGATHESIDMAQIARVQAWLEVLPAPKWPYAAPDPDEVARGRAVFQARCFDCHDDAGQRIGEIIPIDLIGTDRRRFDSYTPKLNQLFLDMGNGKPWDLQAMQKTAGYANRPLDGLWARGPYLHNGSVPTIWDLLTPAAERNGGQPTFRVGHGVINQNDLGIQADVATLDGRETAVFDTRLAGNSNAGHTGPAYGTDLPDEDKKALIAYLKTL